MSRVSDRRDERAFRSSLDGVFMLSFASAQATALADEAALVRERLDQSRKYGFIQSSHARWA